MKEGFVTFLPKGTVSTYCIDKIKPGTFVDIYFDTTSPLPKEAMTFDLSANKTIKALFDKLYILWIMRDNNSHLRCYNLFYQILVELTEFSNAPSYTALRQRDKIKPAVSYMEQYCFDKDFDYDKLPELCGISYSYFKRIFISVYNMPPSKYITHIRLEQAKEMLKSGQYSINAISDMVGYSETSYFSRIFKENIGCSPLHYKNKS
jgi:AraC-like DNA-binding protein